MLSATVIVWNVNHAVSHCQCGVLTMLSTTLNVCSVNQAVSHLQYGMLTNQALKTDAVGKI